MRHIFSLFFFLFFFISLSQNSKIKTHGELYLNKYSQYFELPRETLYTHINKTTFLVGEHIWFKTYVHDRHADYKSVRTTNINVSLFNSSGDLVDSGLWYASSGSAEGQIYLDSTFKSGRYYLKSSTNWMRNFNESDAFIQSIDIIGTNEKESKPDISKESLDIQILPEGGHIVSNTSNVIGLKVLNVNGQGEQVSVIVSDDQGNEITKFDTNQFGIGKFLLIPESDMTYALDVIQKNGITITKKVGDIKDFGITIQANNLGSENLILTLHTNQNTLEQISEKKFDLLIHKNGRSKSTSFSFNSKNEVVIVIPKSNLFRDLNIITVFNEEGDPLVERMIFNSDARISNASYNISQLKKVNDSLVFSIYELSNKIEDSLSGMGDLSITVLPSGTESYNPNDNIISTNYLKPYVQGHIENPKYYFQDITERKKYDLDLLLLTQGWSRYKWSNVFSSKIEANYQFENGLTIKGRLFNPKVVPAFKIQSPELMGYSWVDIDLNSDNTFVLDNMYVTKGEILRISYIDEKGKYRKPAVSIEVVTNDVEDNISESNLISKALAHNEISQSDQQYINAFFYEDAEVLEEVVLIGKKKKEKSDSEKISTTYKDNYIPVDENTIRLFPRVLDIIAYNGYQVNITIRQDVVITKFFKSSPSSSGSPLIILDGVPLNDFNILFNLRSNDFEGISIDKSGLGYGIRGTEGVIRLYSRKTDLFKSSKQLEDYTFEKEATKGFSKPKQFYTPRYKSFTSDLFNNYGVISWIPNINLKKNSSQLFKIPDFEAKSITFFIEGYDTDGKLVSQVISLNK